jgi:hypothetical protein
LGLKGHYGKNKAPWPYTSLVTAFNADRAPADLSPYKALMLMTHDDSKPMTVMLDRKMMKDYGNFKAQFTPGKDWQEFRLALDDFAQPNWAEVVPRAFSDVTTLQFQPGNRDDEEFEFEIDDVRLEK